MDFFRFASAYRGIHHKIAKAMLLAKAKLRRQGFYCTALSGESDYNICINSDLSVSCNCQDFDGSGRLGNLSTNSLEEIFAGATAKEFRSKLAAGKLPLPVCVHCGELRRVPREVSPRYEHDYHVPGRGLMVENTALCNLRCHMCNRELIIKTRSGKVSLSVDDMDRVGTVLQQHAIKTLYFFNLGEPFLCPDVLRQLLVVRSKAPATRIVSSTNGVLLDGEERIEAALLTDYLYFSIDGTSNGEVRKYQVNSDFDRAYRNMAAVCGRKKELGRQYPIVEWKYVLFRWNDRPAQIRRAIELAKEADVDLLGFYNGDHAPWNKSLRWHFHPFFRRLGKRRQSAILLNLKNIPQNLLYP